MDVLQKMISTQALMMCYMLCGVIIRKTGVLRTEGRSSLINLLIDVTLPCMILHSFEGDMSADQLMSAGVILMIAAVLCLGSWGLGLVLWRKEPASRKSVLLFGTMFSNAGNAGLPVVSLVFSSLGVFYASFYLIPLRVLMWTVGVSFYVQQTGKGKLRTLLVNPSVLVIFVGLALMFSGWKLPAFLSGAIANIGNMTGPLSMMLIGATLSDIRLREVLDKDAFLLAAVRLLALPLLALVVMKWLNVDPLVRQVSATLLSMPAANNTAILAEKYGCDHAFASKCVFITTVLSLVTVPLVTLLF